MKTEYEIMFEKFQTGRITETEWREFCDKILDKVLEDNREVFQRLKFRWKFVDDDKKSATFFSCKTKTWPKTKPFFTSAHIATLETILYCGTKSSLAEQG